MFLSHFPLQQSRRPPPPPQQALNDGLSPEDFRRLADACELEESWRPQVGLLAQLGLKPADFTRLVDTRPEVFQTGVATMRKKLQFLRDAVGLSQEELAKVIVKCPRILEYRSEQTIRPRLAFLEKAGVAESDIAKVVIRAPMIMALSLSETLEPRAAFLQKEVGLAQGKGGLGKLIARHPQILTCSEEMMRQRTEYLKTDCGLAANEIARAVLAHPQVLHYKIDSMKERVDYLQRSVGMTEKQVACAVARFPQIFSLAIASNMAPKWRYLVEHLGGDIKALCAYPGYFSLSLANRIIPRHKYLQLQRGDENAPMPFPLGLLKITDKKFATEVAGTTLLEYEEFKEQLLQRNAAEAAFATSEDEETDSEEDVEENVARIISTTTSVVVVDSDDDEEDDDASDDAASWGVLPATTVRQSSNGAAQGGLLGARLYQGGQLQRGQLVRRAHPQ
jgi:mTERF domain-containing protein